MSSNQSNYMPQLDALRGIAVIGVMISHFVPKSYYFSLPLGSFGVQLFFVLSGFLITQILRRVRDRIDEEQGGSKLFALKGFYGRRFLRIFPLYYLVVVLIALLGLDYAREMFAWNLLYISNAKIWAMQSWPAGVGHFWSLALEEQFYLIWPTLIFFLPRKAIVPMIVGTIVLGVATRFFLLTMTDYQKLPQVFPTGSLDALGLGALMGWTGLQSTISKRLVSFAVIPAVIYVVMFVVFRDADPLVHGIRYTAMVAALPFLVARSAVGFKGVAGSFMSQAWLMKMGVISYGIYILHNPVRELLLNSFPGLGGSQGLVIAMLRFLLFCGVTVLVAGLSWWLMESRLLRYKKRFPYLPAKSE